MQLAYAPWVYDLFFSVITLWPMLIILRRMGLPPYWAGLNLFSLLLPFLGQLLFIGFVCLRPWPKLPMPKKPQGRRA